MGDKFENIKKSKIINRSRIIINDDKREISQNEFNPFESDDTFKSEQKKLVSNNEYNSVFSNLKNNFNEKRDVKKLNELIQLESRFNALSEKIRLSIISTEEADTLQNKIAISVLSLIDRC